jgi:hypothetical protein
MINAAMGLGRGLFGRRQQYGTPGYGDLASATPAPMQAAPYERPTAGQFIAGTIGDALQTWGGGRATFAAAMQARQEAAQAQAQYQRQEADKFALWQRQKEWERANPAPVNNDTIADYNFRAQTLGKQAADEWLKSASDPVVTVTLPGNRVYSGPRSGLATALGGAGAQAPIAPVGKLKPIGGATPRASGGFPVR